MTESRRLVPIVTFPASSALVIPDLAKLVAEAEERTKAAQIAAAEQTKPPAAPPARKLVALIGARASGFFT